MFNLRSGLAMSTLALAICQPVYADSPVISTQLTTSVSYEDIADGAVWTSPTNPADDLLIATLEGDGLAVFDAQGKLVLHDNLREVQGADIRYGLKDGDRQIDVLAVGLPDEKALLFYRIDRNGTSPLKEVGRIDTGMAAEAVCLYQNVTTGETTVTGVDDEGDILQYKLTYQNGKVQSAVTDSMNRPVVVRHANVGGELSACVADDETGTLYVSEQDIGVWAYGADAENIKDRRLVDAVAPLGNLEEIESIDLVYQENGKGYLLVADEGKGFYLYGREEGKYLAKFDVKNVEEAKLVIGSANGIWVGNTEADEPVYEKLSLKDLNKKLAAKKLDFNGLKSHRELTIAGVKLVAASGETDAVDDDGDAADDSAFWLNPKDAEQSLIIATNKQGGLMAYDLQGQQVQYLEHGEPNNVDIRSVEDANGDSFALAAASNRDLNTIALYKIVGGKTPIQPLNALGKYVHEEAAELVSNVDEVYGLCMYKHANGTPYIFVNGKNGEIEQWRLTATQDGMQQGMKGELVRTLRVASQPEGCVVDDATATLYVGEEDKAIWTFSADENASTKASLFVAVDGKQLVDDIEGLTLYQTDKVNYLLASSQGNNTYAVYDLNDNNRYLGSFAIIGDDKKGVDGSSDTDGIHAVAANLGADYPEGIFIAQDWNNLDAEYGPLNQNFKIVNWQDIASVFSH